MKDDTAFLIGCAIWFVVAIIAAGVYREVNGSWESKDGDPMPVFVCAMWPLAVLLAVGWALLWSLLWLGRAPVRIVRWRRSRAERLPEARTVQR